jgi:transposase
VTEHRLYRLRCRECDHVTTAPAPAEATAPTCYGPNVTALAVYLLTYQHIPVARTAQLLQDLVGLPVSTGWVAGALTPVAANLDGFAQQVEDALRAAPVAHFDETGIRVAGKNWWLHVACTLLLTAYLPHRQRGPMLQVREPDPPATDPAGLEQSAPTPAGPCCSRKSAPPAPDGCHPRAEPNPAS